MEEPDGLDENMHSSSQLADVDSSCTEQQTEQQVFPLRQATRKSLRGHELFKLMYVIFFVRKCTATDCTPWFDAIFDHKSGRASSLSAFRAFRRPRFNFSASFPISLIAV